MGNRLTIIGLVARAMRGWVAAIECDEDSDSPSACSGGAYSVFYVDARWPNEIQMRGAEADRCELWIEPSDVRAGPGGPELLVDVKIAHRRDGEPAVTEFQIALTEELKPLVH
jgi:hypothetical protein